MTRRIYAILIVIMALLYFFQLLPNYKYNYVKTLSTTEKPTVSLRFWSHSLHYGCRIDTATLLQGLGQTVIVADHFQRKSYYPAEYSRPNILFATDTRPLAQLMHSHRTHSSKLFEINVKVFFDYYKNDSLMQSAHAIYCSFPSSLCEAYMPLNRTIIWLPAHRFTLARCSPEEINRLILHMQQSVQSEHHPKSFVAAGGRYDQEYIKYYTGIDAILLPTNSLWYAFNVTSFTQKRPEILVGPLQRKTHPLIANMINASISLNSSFRFNTAKSLYGHYKLQQIADHRAIVLLPYAVLSYGITELYALGVPIFVPSLDFIVTLGLVRDRSLLDSYYCGRKIKFNDMPKQHPNSSHPFSPDDRESQDAIRYWLNLADYYQLPFIQTFSSWVDLIEKLSSANFQNIHDNMHRENLKRKSELIRKWKTIFAQIDPVPRKIPQDYNTAIRELWNTTKLLAF